MSAVRPEDGKTFIVTVGGGERHGCSAGNSVSISVLQTARSASKGPCRSFRGVVREVRRCLCRLYRRDSLLTSSVVGIGTGGGQVLDASTISVELQQVGEAVGLKEYSSEGFITMQKVPFSFPSLVASCVTSSHLSLLLRCLSPLHISCGISPSLISSQLPNLLHSMIAPCRGKMSE